MSWSDYHLDHPAFCTPLPPLRGLVSAFCERKEAVDSDFHRSCTVSSGAREKLVAGELANTVLCVPGESFLVPEDERAVKFRPVAKNAVSEGSVESFTFMEHFDGELTALVSSGAYVDQAGAVYSSLEQLASSAGYSALVPAEGGIMERNLNARWAVQRRDMLNKLRYVLTEGGYAVEKSVGENGSGSTPQEAYDDTASGRSTTVDSSVAPDLRNTADYYWHSGGYWHCYSATEITRILPSFDGVPAASAGVMTFSAIAPEADGAPAGDSWTETFDPLGTTVSSGVNSLTLSGGVFASWGCGSAAIPAGSSGTEHLRGWEARNVQIIYDYNTTFDFREE